VNGANSNIQPVPLNNTTAANDRQAPSAAAHELCDHLRCQLISEVMDLTASYARSASEAAWRDDRQTLHVHLKQLRLSVLTGIETFKQLGSTEIGRAA
jgi:hypothetical protein